MTIIHPRNTSTQSSATSVTSGSKPEAGQLGPGSKGPEVRELKQLLKDAGFYNGAINDEMGPMGVEALKRAKAELKLGGPADIAGPTTLAELKKAATRGSDSGAQLRSNNRLPSAGSPSSFEPAASTQRPVDIGAARVGTGELLARGAKGTEVSQLQESLNKAGANPPLAVDGDFGPDTEAAVRAFQQRNNLIPDGIVGPATRPVLQKSGGGTPATGPVSAQLGAYKPSFEIKPGSKGPEVERLKKAMKAAGFYNDAINQEMGTKGVEALKKAKAELKLGGAPDVAGEFTVQKIEEYARNHGAANGVAGKLETLTQRDGSSCGLTSVAMIANAANAKAGTGATPINDQDLRAENGGGTGYLPNVLNQHLKGTGFRATDESWGANSWGQIDESLKAGNPVMISTNGQFSASGYGHYITLAKVDGDRVQYADPADGQLKWTTKQTLDAQPAHTDGRWYSRLVKE